MATILNEKWIVCRVCLKQPDETMETIFHKNDEKDMTHMIVECGGVPIKRFDHYPDKICSKCLKYLRVAYKFRVTCQRSYKHLSRCIAPVVVEIPNENDGAFLPIEIEENNGESVLKGDLAVLNKDIEEDMGIAKGDLAVLNKDIEEDMGIEQRDLAVLNKDIEEDMGIEQGGLTVLNKDIEEDMGIEQGDLAVFNKDIEEDMGIEQGDLAVLNKDIEEDMGIEQEDLAVLNKVIEEDMGIEQGDLAVLNKELEEDIGIKQQLFETDNENSYVVDIYEPIEDDAEAFQEFELIERALSELSDDIEYLETEDFHISDEEYLPVKDAQKRGRGRPPKDALKIFSPKASTSRKIQIKKEKLPPLKRRPTPKKFKETQHICEMCGNIYPSKGRLKEHIKSHKGMKPHECEICGHRFAKSHQLTRHMNTHTGNRPYKCFYCPSAFADLSTRNKHHRIHTNERPYICDVCGKSFTYTNTLKFHKMIHTGEKPHVCDICGKGFQQAYKLRTHKETHARKLEKIEKAVEAFESYQEQNVAISEILEI